jgi:hypothetical protein
MVIGSPAGVFAATPSSGSIDPGTPTVSWTGPSQTASTQGPDDASCGLPGAVCDDYMLTVNVAPTYWDTHDGGATFDITWATPNNDFDLYVYSDAAHTQEVNHSAGAPNTEETVFVPKASGTYYVRVVYSTVVSSGYAGTGTLNSVAGGGGGVVFDTSHPLAFAPATIVSANFLAGEPQTTMERPTAASDPNALNPKRVFIDWPVSSRSNIGQLSRSLDGGTSFRLLLDLTCPQRQRPDCATSGGGDTEEDVNHKNGNLFFADQEALVQESLASSTDHGDTFPTARQHAISNATTDVDRQWLAATDSSETVGPQTIESFLSYHNPGTDEYVQGIDQTGLPIPQPAPQIALVGQSGQLRVDTTNGPGHGWIYQPYRSYVGHPLGASHYIVATADSANGNYVNPVNWKDNLVSSDSPTVFPWLSLDDHGNAYALWVAADAQVYYSFSPIDDKANNPSMGGRPGTFWSPEAKVNLPGVTSTIFPEVIAGAPGRIGITYDGSTDCAGSSDNCANEATWNAYGAVITNALQQGGPATVFTGQISHRLIHHGNICTSGTTCAVTMKDRSLLDLTDIGLDANGRIGVVFTDNNSDLQQPDHSVAAQSPFVHFAKLTQGPSLLGKRTLNVAIPTLFRKDRRGDATWPNVEGATNLPSLDTNGVGVQLDPQGNLVFRLRVSDLTTAGMARDLAAYNAATTLDPADRLQYVVRFSTGAQVYHVSYEYLGASTPGDFFGGKLDANDGLILPTSGPGTYAGSGYHHDANFPVTGSFQNVGTNRGRIIFTVPASAVGLAAGDHLFSVTGFTMAGPNEATETSIARIMRTVDATPPLDATL